MTPERILAPLALCTLALGSICGVAQAHEAHHEAGHREAAHHEIAHHGIGHPETAHHEVAHLVTRYHEVAHHEAPHHEAAQRANVTVRDRGPMLHADLRGPDPGRLLRVQDHRDHEFRGEDRDHRGWHGDIHAFHEHDLEIWRGGRWFHGGHDGRRGWWWIVGGVWYFYPAPVYPYPDPYQPPVVTVAPEGVVPPHYVYYCGNPAGYYPYVARCFVSWQRVLAAPQPAVVAAPPPAPGYAPPGQGYAPPGAAVPPPGLGAPPPQ